MTETQSPLPLFDGDDSWVVDYDDHRTDEEREFDAAARSRIQALNESTYPAYPTPNRVALADHLRLSDQVIAETERICSTIDATDPLRAVYRMSPSARMAYGDGLLSRQSPEEMVEEMAGWPEAEQAAFVAGVVTRKTIWKMISDEVKR